MNKTKVSGRHYNVLVQASFRDFRTSDFNKLWLIDQQCFAPGIAYSRFELAAYIQRQKSFTIVAEVPGSGETALAGSDGPGKAETVGFIVTEVKAAVGHVISIDVLPSSRRSGIGSKLLELAEERLIEKNCQSVMLETAVDNHSALSFYKRHGYYVVRSVPRYYPNGVDALVLQKQLSAAAGSAPVAREGAR